jgi:hypothetical protein
MPLDNHRPSRAGSYPTEVKSWHAPELVRVPPVREEYRRVSNNRLHPERVELVSFKPA